MTLMNEGFAIFMACLFLGSICLYFEEHLLTCLPKNLGYLYHIV